MTLLRAGRKIFEDKGVFYHVDYTCRREVVKIGSRRKMMRFMGFRPDPFGSPMIKGVTR